MNSQQETINRIIEYAKKVLEYPKGSKGYDPVDEMNLVSQIRKYEELQAQKQAKPQNKPRPLKRGEKVVLDSGFGYDIGYFNGAGKNYYTYSVEMVTGLVQGNCSYPQSEVLRYTDELIVELTKKYGYEKSFSKVQEGAYILGLKPIF